jgi:nanoRNase/pAp phosphatase (c-di-AMP/oligoRNAs hydrolase)
MGKTVSYFTPTLPSSIYDFLSGIHKISSDFDYANYDLLVFLDFSDFGRINSFYQNNLDYFNNHKTVVIDHHIYKDIHENWTVISDKTSMSACELIFEYANQRRPDLFDENIATYLYL